MSYYHYTKGCHLPSIVGEGIIRTTNEGIEKNEQPAVWLTKSPEWESECNIGLIANPTKIINGYMMLSKANIITATDEYMRKEVGMCRILISEKIPTITWAKYKHVSGISEKTYNSLDKTCRKNGSPVDEWLCTFSAIPKKYWEGIEMYVVDHWVRWDEKIPIREFIDLCLSCNGGKDKRMLVPASTANYVRVQLKFIETHYKKIIDFWKINKHKNGHVLVFVPSDYGSYKCSFLETGRPIQKSNFKILQKSATNNYAYVEFEWAATSTKCYLALPM